jgi:hypothetical protein
MPKEIIIESEFHDAPELQEALGGALAGREGEITITSREAPATFRLEPVITVALITGGAAIVAALITATATILKPVERKVATIQVEDPTGIVLKIPADTPLERIGGLLEAARDRPISRLVVLRIEPPGGVG